MVLKQVILQSYKGNENCKLVIKDPVLSRVNGTNCFKAPFIVHKDDDSILETGDICLMTPELVSILKDHAISVVETKLKVLFDYPPDPAPMALEEHEAYPTDANDEDYSAKVKALDTMSFLYKNTNMTPESVAYVLETVYSALLKSNAASSE